jgi:hypothetical protein
VTVTHLFKNFKGALRPPIKNENGFTKTRREDSNL